VNENTLRCPRCGSSFDCGAADLSTPCACKAVALDATALVALRQRYAGCLCVTCLRDIQRDASRLDATPKA
jgi:Cysteine-rich CWC